MELTKLLISQEAGAINQSKFANIETTQYFCYAIHYTKHKDTTLVQRFGFGRLTVERSLKIKEIASEASEKNSGRKRITSVTDATRVLSLKEKGPDARPSEARHSSVLTA